MQLSDLIGVEYKLGARDMPLLDCYGVAVVFYKELLGIDLPEYTSAHLTDYSHLFDDAGILKDFRQIDHTKEEVLYGDLITFLVKGKPRHIGVAIDNRRMIHTGLTTHSCVEFYKDKKWQKRIYKIHRHNSR